MKVFGTLDMAGLELLASDPAEVWKGRIYFNTSDNTIRIYDSVAGVWKKVLKLTLTIPEPQAGDAGKLLAVNGTVDGLEWVNP